MSHDKEVGLILEAAGIHPLDGFEEGAHAEFVAVEGLNWLQCEDWIIGLQYEKGRLLGPGCRRGDDEVMRRWGPEQSQGVVQQDKVGFLSESLEDDRLENYSSLI